MNLYVNDVVLIYSATPLELNRILQRDFSLISDWYTYNKLTLNVCRKQNNAVKIWGRSLFFSGEGGIDCVSSFKYLSTTLDQKWNWKLHISSPSRKLSHQLSVFNRILHMLDKRSHLAYFNGLVLSQLDYVNTIWGDQPRLTWNATTTGFPKSVCQEDRRWQIFFR